MPVWYWAIFAVLGIVWFAVNLIVIGEYIEARGSKDERNVAIGLLLAFFGGLVVVFAWPVFLPVAFLIAAGLVVKSATKK